MKCGIDIHDLYFYYREQFRDTDAVTSHLAASLGKKQYLTTTNNFPISLFVSC